MLVKECSFDKIEYCEVGKKQKLDFFNLLIKFYNHLITGIMLDILIHNGIIATMQGKGVGIIENGGLGIKGNRIVKVGDSTELQKRYRAHRYLDAENKLLLPGFIDAHMHSGIGLLRGLAQDIDNWMTQGIWPFIKHLSTEASIDGAAVNIIEGLKAGTTTFADYSQQMELIAPLHQKLGTRAVLTETINELNHDQKNSTPTELYQYDSQKGEASYKRALKLFERWQGQSNNRIRCFLGPQGPDMLSKELLKEIYQKAEALDTKIHMHVAQGDREIKQMEMRYNQRSIPWLNSEGFINKRLIAVHLTEATPQETKFVAQNEVSMVLCSGSIGIIDGLIPPIIEFLEVSNKAALGTDQTAGNNCCNMFNEMKLTSILNKVRLKDPKIFPSWKMLRLATIEGAYALGLAQEVGSLEEGKKADIIMIDLTQPSLTPLLYQPVRNIIPNLVYSARGHEVETVIIDGKIIVDEFKLQTLCEKSAIAKANLSAQKLAQSVLKDKDFSSPLQNCTTKGYI